MLCVISGLSSPPGASRSMRLSRSSASGARLKSRVLTSISSSSTPKVSGAEDMKARSVAGTGLSFAVADQRIARRDRAEHVQDRYPGDDDRGEPRAELGCNLVDRLRHADREAGHGGERERERSRLAQRDVRRIGERVKGERLDRKSTRLNSSHVEI